MPNKGAFWARHWPYEKERKAEMERSLAVVRFFYLVFCIVLLFAAQQHLPFSFWKLCFFTVVSLGYALIRYFKPAGAPAGNRLPSAADLLDFLFVGALIYLTGGIRSFFHVAHAIPICGSAIRFGIWGGITGFMLSLI